MVKQTTTLSRKVATRGERVLTRANLAKNRALVQRNIRQLSKDNNVVRSAKGVGQAIYDNDVALPIAKVVVLAIHFCQLHKKKTVKAEHVEAAYRVAILGEDALEVFSESKRSTEAPADAVGYDEGAADGDDEDDSA